MNAAAEIITIGTELLLGDILDSNAAHMARTLKELGLDVYRTTSVGDNEERIAACVREALVARPSCGDQRRARTDD